MPLPSPASRHLLPAALGLALFTSPVLAQPLSYDEAVHGDLPSDGTAAQLNLGAGLNTVKGRMTVISDSQGHFTLDLDPFGLQLAPGLAITGVDVALQFTDDTANTQTFAVFWGLTQWNPLQQWDSCFALAGSYDGCAGSAQGGPLSLATPYTGEQLYVAQGTYHLWKNDQLPSGGSFAYTVSVQVSAIPEPGAALLMLGGLGLLGARLRRR